MTGEADWVALLVVGLELDRMCCAWAGSSRRLVLPCEASGADGACGGCLAGNVGQTDDVVKQGLNLNPRVSIDASITRPELRRVWASSRDAGTWNLEEAWRAERALLLLGCRWSSLRIKF